MTIELTGAEWSAFMEDKAFWWDGRWYQDGAMSINGADWIDWDGEPIASDDKIQWQGGEIYDNGDVGAPFYDMERKLRSWLKARSVTTVVLEVENDRLAAILNEMSAADGVKVMSRHAAFLASLPTTTETGKSDADPA